MGINVTGFELAPRGRYTGGYIHSALRYNHSVTGQGENGEMVRILALEEY